MVFCCVQEATLLFNSEQSLDVTKLNCYPPWSFKSSTVLTKAHVASAYLPNRGFTPLKLQAGVTCLFIVDESAFRHFAYLLRLARIAFTWINFKL